MATIKKKTIIREIRRPVKTIKASATLRIKDEDRTREEKQGLVGVQMELFQTFLCNTNEKEQLSNSIGLWDSLPKYSVSRRRMEEERSPEGHLKRLKLISHWNGREYTTTIHPAEIDEENGTVKSYYPSAAEEIIEEALRKIAADQNGFLDEGKFQSGVVFSVYMLQKELEARGHQRRTTDIIKSLRILALSKIEISCKDEKNDAFTISSFLPSLSAVSKDDIRNNPDARWIAQFHPLVTQSILEITYRQFNYYQLMSHSSQLARWLNRYLIHKYTFASMAKTFDLHYKTVKRDSNLLNCLRERKNIEQLDSALTELVELKILTAIQKEIITGIRGKIEDVIYTLLPHPNFVKEVKAANKRLQDAREILARGNNPKLVGGC